MNAEDTSSLLDSQLARLAHETTLDERFEILKTLVEYWHENISPEDGFSEEELDGIAMPTALRKWFLWAGKRKDVMSGQNQLLEPQELKTNDNKLVFQLENQCCYEWATLAEGVDPPTFGREFESDPWKHQDLRISEHLILSCLFEATMCHAKFSACKGWLEEQKVEWLQQHIPPVSLSPWTWSDETKFFAGDGRFMLTMKNYIDGDKQIYSVWIGAKTEFPLQFAKEIVDESWDYDSL